MSGLLLRCLINVWTNPSFPFLLALLLPLLPTLGPLLPSLISREQSTSRLQYRILRSCGVLLEWRLPPLPPPPPPSFTVVSQYSQLPSFSVPSLSTFLLASRFLHLFPRPTDEEAGGSRGSPNLPPGETQHLGKGSPSLSRCQMMCGDHTSSSSLLVSLGREGVVDTEFFFPSPCDSGEETDPPFVRRDRCSFFIEAPSIISLFSPPLHLSSSVRLASKGWNADRLFALSLPTRLASQIYRETETRGERGTPVGRPQHSRPSTAPNSPQSSSSSLPPQAGPSSYGRRASLADDGASSSDGPSEERRRAAEKARERQLVGSLTTSYKFKEGGLVKKTISVTIHGVAQHLISYYSVEDAKSGRLRSPSTLPELSALEISPDYLQAKHFRFPPKTEIGPDGVLRYRGEPDEPTSPIPGIVPLSSVPLPPARPRTGSRSNAPGDGGRPSSSSASRPRKSSLALQPPPASQFRPPPSPQGWEPGPNVGWGAPTQHSPSFFDPGAPRDSMYPDGVSALNGHPLPTPPFASPWMADTRDSTTGGASYTHPSHHGGHHSGQSSPHFQPSPTFHDEQLYRPDIPTRSFSVNFGEPGVAAVQPIAITERPVLERQASLGNLAAGSFPTSNSSRGSYSSRGLRMYHPYSGAGGDSDNGPASAGSVPNAHSGWPDWQRPSSRARGSGPSSNAGSGSPHVSPLVISGAQLVPSAMNDGPFGPPGSAGPTDDYSFLAYQQQQHQQQPHHQPTAQPPSHSPGYPPSSHNGGPPQLVYPTTHSSYSPAVSPQNTYALPPPPPTYATPHLDPRPSLTTRASISGSHCAPPIDLSRQRYPSEPYPPTTPAFGDNRAAAASASTSTASTMTPPLTSSSTPAMPFVPPSIGAAVRNSGGGSESSSANGFISMYHESASNDVSMRRRSGVDPLLPREGGLASTTGTNATTSAAAAGGESGADQQAGSKDAGEKQQDGQQPRQPTTSNFGWSFGPSN